MRTWVALAWLLGLAFLWAFPALPFQDLPAHAGLVALRERLGHSPVEDGVLIYAPQLGTYWAFRGLGAWFGAAFGPLRAVRLLATLVWIAYPAALGFAHWRLFSRRPSASTLCLGMLVSLGLMTLQGFASYQLGAALLLVVDAEWIVYLRTGRRGWIPAALAAGLVLVHGVAFALCALLAVVAWLHDPRRRLALAWLLPAALFAAWSMHDTPISGWHFSSPLEKLELLVSPTLLTRFGPDAAVSLVLWVLAAAALRRGGVLAAQAGVCFLLFLLAPSAVGSLGSIDTRILPTVLALALLAVRKDGVLAAATFVVLGCALAASALFQREAVGTARIVDRIPPGARLLHLPVDPDSRVFAAHPFLHYDKLALVEKPLVVSDLWFHQGTGLQPRADHPSLNLPKTAFSVLRSVDWPAYHLDDWDYVLIRTQPAQREVAGIPARLARIDHVGGFWLYRVDKPE